jgi:hypothetical protein
MKEIAAMLLVFACFLCMGMGAADESMAVKDIPEPDRNFKVEVVDATDTSFTVDHFSVQGLTFIPVEMGRADVALDFAEIKSATFNLQGEKVRADISFTGERSNSVNLEPGLTFYGKSQWGNVRLEAADIRKIDFIE